MRAYRDCLVVMGAGYLDNTLCTNMMAAPIKGGQLGSFVSLAPTKDRRYFAAVAVVNDFVFVVGGQTAMAGDGSHATNNAFRLVGLFFVKGMLLIVCFYLILCEVFTFGINGMSLHVSQFTVIFGLRIRNYTLKQIQSEGRKMASNLVDERPSHALLAHHDAKLSGGSRWKAQPCGAQHGRKI